MDFFINDASVKMKQSALQRVICRGMKQQIRSDIQLKPFLRLVNSQAQLLCSDVDVTKGHVAYGRLAIPLLKRDVLSSNPVTQKQALSSLLDMVHDPEKAVEAIWLKVVPRLVRLMLSQDTFVKQHSLMILEVLALQPGGVMEIVQFKNILHHISILLEDSDDIIRLSAAKTLLAFSTNYFGIDELIKNDFISIVISRLNSELQSDIKIILLQILELLLDKDMDAKLEALNCGAIKIVAYLEYSDKEIQSSAASVIAQLVKHPKAKEDLLNLPEDVLSMLTNLLEDSDVNVKTHVSAVLMFVMCKTDAKLRCLKLPTPVSLLRCAQSYQHPGLQLNAIKTLTSFAESPAGQRMLKEYLDQITTIRSADKIVRHHKKVLLTVINRVI